MVVQMNGCEEGVVGLALLLHPQCPLSGRYIRNALPVPDGLVDLFGRVLRSEIDQL